MLFKLKSDAEVLVAALVPVCVVEGMVPVLLASVPVLAAVAVVAVPVAIPVAVPVLLKKTSRLEWPVVMFETSTGNKNVM